MTCTSPHSGQETVTVVVELSKSFCATIITLTPHLQRQVDIVVITVAQILRRGHSTSKQFHTEVIYEGWPVLMAALDQQVRKMSTKRDDNSVAPVHRNSYRAGTDFLLDATHDRVTRSDPSVTDYVLEQPAKCPNLRLEIPEKTLIEPR
jgi:hypothetical protein